MNKDLPPYHGKPYTCIVCGISSGETTAPDNCVLLHSRSGNYGSRVFDGDGPSGGVVAFVHDSCFVDKVKDGTILAIAMGRAVTTRQPDTIVRDWDPLEEPPAQLDSFLEWNGEE